MDIWHCDAGGTYSGYEAGKGERFLRGAQVTNAEGIARFTTIYPGWYEGRTVHIHAKVHLDKHTVLTTQLFFDEKTQRVVYSSQGDTDNASDGIFDESLVLATRSGGGEHVGAISFDVARA